MRAFTRSRLLLGALAALSLAGGAAAFVHSSSTKVAEPVARRSGPQAADRQTPDAPELEHQASTAVTERAPSCAFPVDAELSYRLDGSFDVKMDTNVADAPVTTTGPSSKQTASVTLDLKAARELVDETATGTVLVAKMRDVSDAITHSRGDVTAPFLLRVDPLCKIVGFARLASTPVREGRNEQALAYGLQWSFPRGDADLGENDYGAYRASSSLERGQALLVQRTIAAYTRVWSAEGGHGGLPEDVDEKPGSGPEEKPLASRITVDVGAGPWFAALHSTERLHTLGADVTTEVTVRALVPLASGQAFAGVPLEARKYIWQDLLPRHVPEVEPSSVSAAGAVAGDSARSPYHPVSLKRQVEAAKKLTLPQAMTAFKTGIANHGTVADVWSGLETFLEAHPEAARTVAAQIKSGEIDKKTDAAVFIALSRTPNVEARDALLAMNSDTTLRAYDRARSAFALATRDDVGIDLAQTLHTDSLAITSGATFPARMYARHAALALGILANRNADEHPEIVSEAESCVADILKNKDVDTLQAAFATAANIGDSSMLSQLAPYMVHSDPRMRRASAVVMRRMAPNDTTATATAWLARETDPSVVLELYRVLGLQHLDAHVIPDRALLRQAIADLNARPSGLTRGNIIRLLALAIDTVPEVRAALLASLPAEYAARKEGVYPLLASYFTSTELAAATAAGETNGN